MTNEIIFFMIAIIGEALLLNYSVPKLSNAMRDWFTAYNDHPGYVSRINTQKDIDRHTVAKLLLMESIKGLIVKYLLISLVGISLVLVTIYWTAFESKLWNYL